jgi:hypothetical protein
MSQNVAITRNAVVFRLGTPTVIEGSLNDPREREENGFHFNEKWLYEHLVDDPSGAEERFIYWHRYDFVGTMVRNNSSESWRPDTSLVNELNGQTGRSYLFSNPHNPSVPPATKYRPVSEFKGPPDLGGHREEI